MGTSTRQDIGSRRLVLLAALVAAGAALLLGSGCLTNSSNINFQLPLVLLERDDGSTVVAIAPETSEQIAAGVMRYTGAARAQIGANSSAGRAIGVIDGHAEAVVDENTQTREFTFTSSSPSDIGWSGVETQNVTITGSGPPSGGTATLNATALLDDERASTWGFYGDSVNIAANLATERPVFAVYSESGWAGNPVRVVGAPNPGGVSVDASSMALVFAPVAGDTGIGATEAGNFVKFATGGSPLSEGVTLAWNTDVRTLEGAGSVSEFPLPGGSANGSAALSARPDASSVEFSGQLATPQLGILSSAQARLWTDGTCFDCADIVFSGENISVSTLNIPRVEARQEIRHGAPTLSLVSATGVNGSLGPVTINSGSLTADFSDPANMIADLNVSGSVLGMPVTTTFRGPFFFDLDQGSIGLQGDLYLNMTGKVVLNGKLAVNVGLTTGVTVNYNGAVAIPGYGTNLNVNGSATYNLSQQSLNLSVTGSGNVGPATVTGIAVQLNLVPSGGGIGVSGSLNVGSVTTGQASLTNLKISVSGNTASTLTATINSSADRVRFRLGSTVDVNAFGSLTYNVSNNSFAFSLNFAGRVGSWQLSNGSTSVTWTSSGPVTGSISVGNISNGQVTISNATLNFSASSTAVNVTLQPTTITAGTMVSATVSGNATYNATSNVFTLNLSASGRVGSWNVSGVSATFNWPGSGSVTGTVTVGQVSNGQATVSNAIIDVTASSTSVTATLRPTTITAGSLVSATVSGNATYNTSTQQMTLSLTASGRVGSINVSGVSANVNWPLSGGNVTGTVTIGTVSYGPASLTGTSISFTASSTTVTASIASTLNVGDPFRLTVGLSGTATYNVSTNVLNAQITTGSGTMWGKPISGSVTFNVNIASSTISGSVTTSSVKFTYDKFGITLTGTTLNFSVSGSTVTVTGGGNVAVTGPINNGWLSGSGSFSVNGNTLSSSNYRIKLNNANKTIIWVDVGPRNGVPLTVNIISGSLSYDASGVMRARVDTGFPFYCEDLEFAIRAWGDQNVLRVDFEGSWVIGLFGARGHMDVYDWLSSNNPPMYGYADARITFFWFRYQTWNGQSLENGGC